MRLQLKKNLKKEIKKKRENYKAIIFIKNNLRYFILIL